jgi:hypothetical protein
LSKNKENKDNQDDDDEMIQLRMNLLNNLNEKRTIKKQKQLELEQEQVKQIDQDISIFKKKLIEHEQELLVDDKAELTKKQLNSTAATSLKATNKITSQPSLQTTSTGTSSLNNLKSNVKSLTSNNSMPKISPVIIRLNSNETESDDEFSTSATNPNPNKQLESSIGLFLKEAKILAELKSRIENENRKSMLLSATPSDSSLKVASTNLRQNSNAIVKSNIVVSKAEEADKLNERSLNIENLPLADMLSDENRNSLSEQQQKSDKDKEKKNVIKSLRDRINLKR